MIGVFDSGRGGLYALQELRSLAPHADILYLADTQNAPYGTKSASELLPLIKRDIARLCRYGATRILIACGTASSLYPHLDAWEQAISFPLSPCVAKEALTATKNGRIGVLATARTILSGCFREYLTSEKGITLTESVGTALVPLVESGRLSFDDPYLRTAVSRACAVHKRAGVDTLILGCTHFPALTQIFLAEMGKDVTLIPSGEVAARSFFETLTPRECDGDGITVYL